jgi:subtilase family serine protease
VIPHNVSPRTNPEFDEGAVSKSFVLRGISILLKPTPAQRQELNQLLREQQDPSSPNYRKWITPDQYGDRFGASKSEIEALVGWLKSQGFQIKYAARGRSYISFDGTAAQVQNAFHTPIHRFHVDGEEHYANTSDPSVPAEFASRVLGLLGLDDFYPKPNLQTGAGYLTIGSSHFLAPDDIATIYDINGVYNAGYDASGQSVVVVGESDINTQDLTDFLTAFGLPAFNLTQILYPGSPDPGTNGALIEADLDLEWMSGTARSANVLYVFGVNANGAAAYAIDQNLAPVISESFGLCELNASGSMLSALEMEAQKANAEGITWLASSGDFGAADCDHDATIATHGLSVNVPASTPEITAVGGTEFNEGAGNYWSPSNSPTGESALSYIPEIAWNDTAAVARLASSGGGRSIFFSKPTWQTGTGTPSDGARDLPDLSFTASDAHDPYLICTQDGISGCSGTPVGGTSASTPVFAGVVTLLNKYLSVNGVLPSPGLGNINPTIYGLAQIQFSPPIFHDVIAGANEVPCQAGTTDCPNGGLIGYSAGQGYDLVTGWGSVDAGFLVGTWPGPPTQFKLQGPSSTTAGSSLAFSLSVFDKNTNYVVNYADTVRFTSSDQAAVLPGDYTSTTRDAGFISFNVTLKRAGSQTVTVTDVTTGTLMATVSITVSPAAANHFSVAAPATITAGSTFSLTVTAQDPFNNTVSTYNGSVSFFSSDPKAVLPASYTFISADSGAHTFTGVLLETAGSQTITTQDASGNSGIVNVFVAAGPAVTFGVTAPPQVQVSESFSATVTARDAFNNVATGYTGTIAFTSSDASAGLPANYTFTVIDGGAHTFSNALVFNMTGSQSVTVRDTATASLQTTANFTVLADLPLTAIGRTIRFFRPVQPLVVATVTDADASETGTHLSAVIDWGDGSAGAGTIVRTSATPNTFNVLGSHGYLKRGPFSITVRIMDSLGSQAIAHSTASFLPHGVSY